MPYVYLLGCADSSYYTGSTTHLELRYEQHISGRGSAYTAKRLPVKLVHVEEYQRIDDAFGREKQIQSWSRKKKQALIASDFNQLCRLAACMNTSRANALLAQAVPSQASTTLSPREKVAA